MGRIFDSHAHYDDAAFGQTAQELLHRLHNESDVCRVVNAGSNLASSRVSETLAEQLDFVYFAAGVHPEHAAEESEHRGWLEGLEALIRHPKCVAVGEIGLDYYYGKESAEQQKRVFSEQMALAERRGLPVVVHDREAHADCLDMVLAFPKVTGVFHCYSGSFEMAKELLKRGWFLSFNGIVTFKNARKTVEVLEGIRDFQDGKYLERILVETDCPYLAPVPVRGTVNHSGNILYTARRCGEILKMDENAFLELTYRNACRFFGLEE